MLARRIVPRFGVARVRVVNGARFVSLCDAVACAARCDAEGAGARVLLGIGVSTDARPILSRRGPR